MRKKLCQKWFAVLLGIVLLFQQSVVYATATETESLDSLTYSVIWEQMEHGELKDSTNHAVNENLSQYMSGDQVKLKVSCENGYEVEKYSVKASGQDVSAKIEKDNLQFMMPEADVTIDLSFKAIQQEQNETVEDESTSDETSVSNVKEKENQTSTDTTSTTDVTEKKEEIIQDKNSIDGKKNEGESKNQDTKDSTDSTDPTDPIDPIDTSELINPEEMLQSITLLSARSAGVVDSYQKISALGTACGKFTVNGNMAFCTQHNKSTPPAGTTITSIYESGNEMMRKALYYGFGGPAARVASDADGWVYTSIALSNANGVRAGTESNRAFYNTLSSLPNTPSSFHLYICTTASANLQDLAYWTYNPEGYLTLKKESANPDYTNNNPAFSLAGAVFEVYSDNGCTNKVATFTTDDNGNTSTVKLNAGTYYVKEVTPSQGFGIQYVNGSPLVQAVSVPSSNTATLTWKEYPKSDPIGILLNKVDAETGEGVAQGNASLAGAEYEVKFYTGTDWTEDPAQAGEEPVRTWLFKTNENGFCYYSNQYLVSGDPLWYASNGAATLPLGTITIQEVTAPEGYLLNDELYVRNIPDDGYAEWVNTYNAPIQKEQVIRGDLEIYKVDSKSKQGLEGVEFTISNKVTGEVVKTITTDANGYATTKDEAYPDGALPYGKYVVEETKALPGYMPLDPIEVEINENNVTIPLNLENDHAEIIKTEATDTETGLHQTYAQKNSKHKDRVNFKNLIPGVEYELKCVPYLYSTKKPLGQDLSFTKKFTMKEGLTYEDVDTQIDTSALQGDKIVYFEYLYVDGVEIAHHTDIEDKGQTIEIFGISTSATGTNDKKVIKPTENATIVDKINYWGSPSGKQYRAVTTVVDQNGMPITENGQIVKAEKIFSASATTGSEEATITINARNLQGKKLTVYEEIYDMDTNKLVAEHKDVNSTAQTITIGKDGKIITSTPDNMRSGWNAVKTGDNAPIGFFLSLITMTIIILVAFAISYITRKKEKNYEE